MQVYGSFTSPYVRHVRIVIEQTNANCEFIETDAKASASGSPTQKVPYLKDGDVELTDSMSIIRYLREQAGQTFLGNIADFDLYCLVNTLMDSCVNLFLLERSGLNTSDNGYLQRQAQRIETGLAYLNTQGIDALQRDQDLYYRVVCFIAWGQYRQRFSLEGLDVLQQLLAQSADDPLLTSTQPPAT